MQIEGTLKNITFRNSANGFSVLKFVVSGEARPVTVTGTFPELSAGETLRMEGEWKTHPKYGRQFVCAQSETVFPTSGEGLVAYLSGGLFKGIGQATAKRLVDTFGADLVNILDGDGDELGKKKIKGFSGKRAAQFLHDWKQMRESRETMLFLYGHGITGSVALRLWRQYSTNTIRILAENPYILCEDVWGVGFVKADEIARKVGISEWNEARLEAGICYAMIKASSGDGHTYLPQSVLLQNAVKELRLPIETEDETDTVFFALENLLKQKRLNRDGDCIAIPSLVHAENFIANFVAERISDSENLNDGYSRELENFLSEFEKAQGFSYDPTQKVGIVRAFQSKIFIVTGGPGTGKTTLLKGILALADSKEIDVTLAAPTGRAAKRMQNVTGHTAKTLHRLLEINPESRRFMRDENFPIETGILVVDEFSMVDSWLCAGLMKAIPERTRLILIGDKDQLPSIGPGNVLCDLLSVPQIPGIRLEKIFRQAGGNDIAEKATLINQGMKPVPLEGNNFHYVPFENPEEALNRLSEIVIQEIPRLLGKSAGDLQVLVPMHKGPLGTIELNAFLQNLLNDAPKGFDSRGISWKHGDRVMQIRNNYEKNVFNGDIGKIIALEKDPQKITVDFEGHLVGYEGDDLEELALAYACTIHKSQGSEYPAVVIVLDSSHYRMLQRNLIYTGITRAKGHVWVLSGNGALDEAIRNNRMQHRYTRLRGFIADKLTGCETIEKSPEEKQSGPYDKFLEFLDE